MNSLSLTNKYFNVVVESFRKTKHLEQSTLFQLHDFSKTSLGQGITGTNLQSFTPLPLPTISGSSIDSSPMKVRQKKRKIGDIRNKDRKDKAPLRSNPTRMQATHQCENRFNMFMDSR